MKKFKVRIIEYHLRTNIIPCINIHTPFINKGFIINIGWLIWYINIEYYNPKK